ncbi:uncharacterized protein V2V93DRAFT_362873 [Kockiozyma suomiensis]|uniref:uncharacterized protein n=1 Tax=Kockiozyma suomiensis TaxID=1337062 RepID=UPI0033438C81
MTAPRTKCRGFENLDTKAIQRLNIDCAYTIPLGCEPFGQDGLVGPARQSPQLLSRPHQDNSLLTRSFIYQLDRKVWQLIVHISERYSSSVSAVLVNSSRHGPRSWNSICASNSIWDAEYWLSSPFTMIFMFILSIPMFVFGRMMAWLSESCCRFADNTHRSDSVSKNYARKSPANLQYGLTTAAVVNCHGARDQGPTKKFRESTSIYSSGAISNSVADALGRFPLPLKTIASHPERQHLFDARSANASFV